MPNKSYNMLCPITRALDHIGDRWSLLILRDLHPGPARYSELRNGLPGIAKNLLSDRLSQLIDSGLIDHITDEAGKAQYALSEKGKRSADLLFELARFGGLFAPTAEPSGTNLRALAITFQGALRRVATADHMPDMAMIVDDTDFNITARNGLIWVKLGPLRDPAITLTTSYDALVKVGDGEITAKQFFTNHMTLDVPKNEMAAPLKNVMRLAIDEIRAHNH